MLKICLENRNFRPNFSRNKLLKVLFEMVSRLKDFIVIYQSTTCDLYLWLFFFVIGDKLIMLFLSKEYANAWVFGLNVYSMYKIVSKATF